MKGVDYKFITTNGVTNRRNAFDDYLKQGGFPELLQIKNNKKYITNLIDNILKRDIEQRFKISYPA